MSAAGTFVSTLPCMRHAKHLASRSLHSPHPTQKIETGALAHYWQGTRGVPGIPTTRRRTGPKTGRPPSLQLMRKQPGAQHGGIETPGLVRTAQQTVKGKPGRTTPRRTSNNYKLFGVLLTNTGGDWQDRQTAARRTHTNGPGIPPAATRTKSPREASRTIHTYTHTHVTTHPHEYTPTHNNTHAFFLCFFLPKAGFFFIFFYRP